MKLYRVTDSEYRGDGTFTDLDEECVWVHHETYINAHDENQASFLFHKVYESDLPDCYTVEEVGDFTLAIAAGLLDPIVGIYH